MTRSRSALEVRSGDRPSASTHNALVRAALRNHAGRGKHVDSTGTYERDRPQRAICQTALFMPVSEQDDHLMCRRVWLDGSVASENVPVAKFWFARRSSLDGRTLGFTSGKTYRFTFSEPRRLVRRNVENDAENEEVMKPGYVLSGEDQLGEIIVARRGSVWIPNGNGGLARLKVDGKDVQWEDLNVASRHWGTAPSEPGDD